MTFLTIQDRQSALAAISSAALQINPCKAGARACGVNNLFKDVYTAPNAINMCTDSIVVSS